MPGDCGPARHVSPCGPSSRSALGAILPLHDVRYHARAVSLPASLPESATDGREFVFSANEQTPAWWSQTGSNRRPPACKAGALPTELWPRTSQGIDAQLARSDTPDAIKMVGLGRLELPTSRLSSARSNQLSYKPGFWSSGPPPPTRRSRHQPRRLHTTAVLRTLAARGSFAKKEKRRRRCPADGLIRPETNSALMFPRDPIEDA